jgi:hypothetical protein
MTRSSPIEAKLRQPPPDERGYAPPGLRSNSRLGRPADPMWRDVERGSGRSIVFGVAATLVVLSVVVIALIGGVYHGSQAGESAIPPTSTPSVDVSGPAIVLGVDPQAVIRTADGYVAARRIDRVVELAIAQASSGDWSSRVLASFIEPRGFGGSAVFEVTCDASFGLRQPNFVYGDEQDATFARLATIKVTGLGGSGSPFGNGPWVVAFTSEGPIRDVQYELTADRGQQYRPERIGGGSFHDPQRCGTVEDVTRSSVASPTPPPPAGSGRVVLEPAQVLYNGQPPNDQPPATSALGPVRIVTDSGLTVFDDALDAVRTLDLAAGGYSVHVKGGLNDCDASVSIVSGKTTEVSIEWFAGGCRVTVGATN